MARDLRPTLRDVHALAPELEKFFTDLDPLITVSQTGMPATREILGGTEPLLDAVHPFLGQLNPILQFLEASQWQVAGFLNYGAAALADTTSAPGGGVGHHLRRFGVSGSEAASMYQERPKTNRGNSYFTPMALSSAEGGRNLTTPQWDCNNTGGEHGIQGEEGACWVQDPMEFQGLRNRVPHVQANDYRKGN